MSFLFVKNRFEAVNNVQLQETWLQKCLDKLKQNSEYQNANNQKLYQAVYNEFLESDLKQSIKPSLPPLMDSTHKIIIGENRPVILQIVEIFEVGIPNQTLLDIINSHFSGTIKQGHKYNDIRDRQNEPIQFPRAMLRLYLTDGAQIIDAVEFKPLEQLNLLTPIGTKHHDERRNILVSEGNQNIHPNINSDISVDVSAHSNIVNNEGSGQKMHSRNRYSSADESSENHNRGILERKDGPPSTKSFDKAMGTERSSNVTTNHKCFQNGKTSGSFTESVAHSQSNTSVSTHVENAEAPQTELTPRLKNNAQQLFDMYEQLWDEDELENMSFFNSQMFSANDDKHNVTPQDNPNTCNSQDSVNKNDHTTIGLKGDDVSVDPSNNEHNLNGSDSNDHMKDKYSFLMDDIEYDPSFMDFQNEGFEIGKTNQGLREIRHEGYPTPQNKRHSAFNLETRWSLKHTLDEEDLIQDDKPKEKKRCTVSLKDNNDLTGSGKEFIPIEIDHIGDVEEKVQSKDHPVEYINKNKDTSTNLTVQEKLDVIKSIPSKERPETTSTNSGEPFLASSPTSSPPIISSLECFQLPSEIFDDISPIATHDNTFNDISSFVDIIDGKFSSTLANETDKNTSNILIKPMNSNGDVIIISDDEEEGIALNDLGYGDWEEKSPRDSLIFGMSQDEELPSEEDLVRSSIFKNKIS
ncbi:10338_t:CDS:2 [Acaulospora colombiana]|uniref:10338_t:CDS:1 n=1 Tax=Acaulospora colombiana TaxID=27376 RepID=A0ACA9LIC6_9GLOM|nr:10338_t:CDS:2 [Acaulospora colombiana]